jgi:hypothetical protein
VAAKLPGRRKETATNRTEPTMHSANNENPSSNSNNTKATTTIKDNIH